MIAATVTGYLSALSLILAIGAQNAFVLRQSLTRNHIFAVCLFCALSDTVLIVAGVLGFGAVVTLFPALPKALAIAGACFLAVYALIRLREAFRGHYLTEVDGNSRGLRKTLLIAAALTWLNPHVYLDTMGLLGAISTQYETTALRAVFSVSASVASFTFFFALGYGGRFLAPVMRSVRAWRILDTAIALVMAALAVSLLRFAV
jgi:L-lysine exporter family protein LysE/ArgO